MCVTLIGGMDRLKPEYMAAAKEGGHSLKCISRNERNFVEKIGNPDAVIVFTNKISHAKPCNWRARAISPFTWFIPAGCRPCGSACVRHDRLTFREQVASSFRK